MLRTKINLRHVVGSGPFVGHIVCENHEEADVHAVYRDPGISRCDLANLVHDFGYCAFDLR
jgi:pro-apoptotic serine protease NMA111